MESSAAGDAAACPCAEEQFVEQRTERLPDRVAAGLRNGSGSAARNSAPCGGYVRSTRRNHTSAIGSLASTFHLPVYTQPVGFGRPANLQAPLAGPDGNSW